jgi:hypothetical protein
VVPGCKAVDKIADKAFIFIYLKTEVKPFYLPAAAMIFSYDVRLNSFVENRYTDLQLLPMTTRARDPIVLASEVS